MSETRKIVQVISPSKDARGVGMVVQDSRGDIWRFGPVGWTGYGWIRFPPLPAATEDTEEK